MVGLSSLGCAAANPTEKLVVLVCRDDPAARRAPVLQELAVDGVLVDQTISAGGTAARRAGVPFVTLCAAMLWNEDAGVPPPFTAWPYASDGWSERRNRLGYAGWHWFIRPVLDRINRYRRRWQFSRLSTIEDAYSPLAQISQLCAEFDFARRRLPDVFHYVGSLVANRRMKTECPFPWEWLDGRPFIFASLGTVPDTTTCRFPQDPGGVRRHRRTTRVDLGGWDEEDEQVRAKLGEIPAQRLGRRLRAQQALLDRAAVLITHAGVNTVLESLSRAVPMVALPRSADQPAMGSRIAHAGVGLLGPSVARPPGRFENWSSGFCRKRCSGNGPKRCRRPWPRRAGFAAGRDRRKGPSYRPACPTRKPLSRGTPPRQLEAGLMKGSRFVEELVAARGCGAAVTEFVCTTPPVCAAARRSQEPAASGGCNLSFSKVAEAGIEPARG